MGLTVAALFAGPAAAQEPFRLEAAVGAPDWLTLEGEARVRYESLDGQFRANGSGGDQILVFRTLLLAEADAGPIAFGAELQDSRAYLDDAGTPISTGIVNPLDVLQAYVRLDLDGVLGSRTANLKLGRQTVSIGSRRVIERVEFANVIYSYTGAHWTSTNARGDALHLLHVSPTGRFPTDREGLADNDLSGDEEQWGRRFWGVHYRRADAFGVSKLWAEAFLYGLDERDTDAVATPNRDYLQPGFRLARAPKVGRFDLDIEGAYRTGTRRRSAAASEVADLDVEASMLYAHVGYTFSHAWRPRLGVEYYFASGDEDPNDDRFDQYERLFGSRRTDLGNTSIHGPLTPANLSAPGLRLEIAPTDRFDARVAYKAASLAQARDRWVIARVQDPSGESGRFIGHAIDARARYWLVPQSLHFEAGASALIKGRFAEDAPNAADTGDTLFGYVQLTQTF
jgi:hypothetical protein